MNADHITHPKAISTKLRIWETFRSMLLEMEYSEITVTELTRRVGIHRKTFYLHYECIDSLFHELEAMIISQLKEIIIDHNNQQTIIDFETILRDFIHIIETDPSLYRRIFFTESYLILYHRIYDQIAALSIPYIKDTFRITLEEAIVVTNFIMTGYFEMLRTYQKNNLCISDEHLNSIFRSLINKGLSIYQ